MLAPRGSLTPDSPWAPRALHGSFCRASWRWTFRDGSRGQRPLGPWGGRGQSSDFLCLPHPGLLGHPCHTDGEAAESVLEVSGSGTLERTPGLSRLCHMTQTVVAEAAEEFRQLFLKKLQGQQQRVWWHNVLPSCQGFQRPDPGSRGCRVSGSSLEGGIPSFLFSASRSQKPRRPRRRRERAGQGYGVSDLP